MKYKPTTALRSELVLELYNPASKKNWSGNLGWDLRFQIKCHISYRKSQWIRHFIYFIEYPNSFNSFNAIETDFLSDSPSQKAE